MLKECINVFFFISRVFDSIAVVLMTGDDTVSSFILPAAVSKALSNCFAEAGEKWTREHRRAVSPSRCITRWVYPGGNVGRSPRQHPRPDGNVDLWRARCMCLCVRLYVLYGYYGTSRRGKDNAAASREYIKQRVADRSNTSHSVTTPIP